MSPDMLFPFLILGLFLFIFATVIIGSYNEMVEMGQRANQAFADVDALLKKRRDLIPNLVATVRGSSAHESQALETVVRLRATAAAATDPKEKMASEQKLSAALGSIFALSEAYPDLKANANFLALQEQLSGIESELSEARQTFNFCTASYNSERQKIPMVFVASALGFKPYNFFDVGAEERSQLDTPPSISF